MNPVTDIIFTISWFVLLVWAIRSMSKGWGAMNTDITTYNKTVTKPIHPGMVDVKPGEELMGVTFKKQEPDELQQSLQARIEALSEDIEDEDEDDGGGDVIVRV